MARLSEKRRQAIYNAVHKEITDLRIELLLVPHLDAQIAQAGERAASAAVHAATGERGPQKEGA